MNEQEILAALNALPVEAQAAIMAGLAKPLEMAQGTAVANLGWALFDLAIAVVVFAVLCSWKPVSYRLFEYDDELDEQAHRLKTGAMTDPIERGMTTESLGRVKAAKIVGFLILMGLALVQ